MNIAISGNAKEIAAQDRSAGREEYKMKVNPVLMHVKEVKETRDIKEVAQLLSTKQWIATYAAELPDGEYYFVLGFIGECQ